MVDVAGGLMEFGLKLTVMPAGAPETLSVTLPEKLGTSSELIVNVLVTPLEIVRADGVAGSQKPLVRLLIQSDRTLVASSSTRFESSGGIWMELKPRVATRLNSTE